MNLNILKAAYFTPRKSGRWGLEILATGGAGIGKSDSFEGFTHAWNEPILVVSPVERGEAQFGVIPVPVMRDGRTVFEYPVAEELIASFPDGRGLLLIDEMGWAPSAIQPALFGLLRAGRIGSYTLPPGVRRMAASNPTSYTGNPIFKPTANRVVHLLCEPPAVDEHMAWETETSSLMSGGNARAEETRVLSLWNEARAQKVGVKGAFLARFPGLKNQEPPDDDPHASGPWPSDRTWEMLTDADTSATIHELSEVDTEVFLEGCIGAGAAEQYITFARDLDIPDPKSVLDGETSFRHNEARLDKTLAVMESCLSLMTSHGFDANKQRQTVLWSIFDNVGTANLDTIAPFVMRAINAKLLKGDPKVTMRVNSRINPVVRTIKGV